MLSMKKINLICKLIFDLDMSIKVISYKLDISPSSIYKILDDLLERLLKYRK